MEIFTRILVICVVLITTEAQQLINVARITERIDVLARDALGRDKIQELVDNEAQFTTSPITQDEGSQLADQLSSTLSERFGKYFTALERTKTTAESEYAAGVIQGQTNKIYNGEFPECCTLKPEELEYDARFFTEADPNSNCYRVSADSPETYSIPATQTILEAFEENFRDNPGLKWQYVGTEEGVMLKFPAHVSEQCGTYDPRFRPWYVASSSPVPKDLVLVIDSSGSMGPGSSNGMFTRMEIAKEAAVTVVETLNPNDRIGIVRFSDSASTPPGSLLQSTCYNDHMAYAIPDNVRYLKSYIQDIQDGGQTNYLDALDVAFGLLQRVTKVDGQSRDKVILFLTDGEPTGASRNDVLQKIRELNGAMDNAVTMMTYGLSIEKLSADELLRDMAKQTESDSNKGDINVGVYTKINSVENLRFDLGSYYSHFSSKAALEKPIISVPYIDFSGLGLISSICDTILHSGELKGVTCIDVRIADILGDIEYAQPGELSYTFIIDKTGRTLVHPLLSSPFKVDDDPLFIDIAMLERAPEAESVIASMKSGGSDEKTFKSDFTVGMGHSKQHGVEVRKLQATYIWRQIDKSDLSFCMVFAESDKEVEISVQGNTENFLYHRFDVKQPDELCNHAGRLSTIGQSSVAFADDAYDDVRLKDSASLTAEDLDKMNIYMSSEGFRWNALKAGVKDTVVITEYMEAFWKSKNDEYARYVSSRFLGTENGVFRVYPGISLAVNYSHMDRAWYSDAVANRDKLVMSVPYVDAFRAGVVTSIMHSILEGKTSHSSDDTVIGVIGADFNIAYIRYLLMDTYPQCAGDQYMCFLMDESGYMIYHSSVADETRPDVNRHIIRHEPEIAQVLIDRSNLVREECVSLGENKAWHTWRMSSQQPVEEKSSFLSFELQWVSDSNVFLGIKATSSQTGSANCNCPESGSAEFKCTRTDAMFCECPCFAIADYDYCSNSFMKESLPAKTCTPPTESKQYKSPLVNEEQLTKNLPYCFNVNCEGIESEGECSILSSCSWCPIEQDGAKQCTSNTECIDDPNVTPSPSDGKNGTSSGGPNVGAIAGGVVAGVVVLVVVGVVVAVVLKRRADAKSASNSRPREPLPPSATALHDPHYKDPSSLPNAPPQTLVHDGGYMDMDVERPDSLYHEIPDARVGSGMPGEKGDEAVRIGGGGQNGHPVYYTTHNAVTDNGDMGGYEAPHSQYDVPPPNQGYVGSAPVRY